MTEVASVARVKFTADLTQSLRLRVASHNNAYPEAATKLGDLKALYKREHQGDDPGGRAMGSVDAHLAELVQKAEADLSGRVLPTISVPLSSLPVYESGATLFAFLAFPGADEAIERGEAHVALCSLALHAMAHRDPASIWVPQLVKPGYLMFPKRNVDRVLRTFDRRFQDRMVAAAMAMPLLQEAETGRVAPDGTAHLSISQLASSVLELSGEESPVNVQSRIWALSLPVVHLAVATADVISQAQKGGAQGLDVQILCCDPHFVRSVVQKAERYEALFALAPKLALALKRLVRFRLA